MPNIIVQIEDLAAGVDIAERAEYVVPDEYDGLTVFEAILVSKGAPAGIDAANPAQVQVRNLTQAAVIVDETFNAANPFPAANAIDALTLGAAGPLRRRDVLSIIVTNGVTANPPAFAVVLMLRPLQFPGS